MNDIDAMVLAKQMAGGGGGGGIPDAPSDGQLYGRKDGAWVVLDGFVEKHNITISMIGSLGNIPVGNTVMVYMITPLGQTLYDSFLYEEETTISAPEGMVYRITGTQDAEGFINPSVIEGTLLNDAEVEIEYKEFGTIETWDDIGELSRAGVAKRYMEIGDTFTDKYTATNGTEYNIDWRLKKFMDIELENEEVYPDVPIFATEGASVESISFDVEEALYYTEEELAPGDYYFEVKSAYQGWNVGDTPCFTLDVAIPAGGQISTNLKAVGGGELTFTIYDSPTAAARAVKLVGSSGTSGTKLGEVYADKVNGNCNAMQRVWYGNGNWKESAYRQWLNKATLKDNWWEPQNGWDRAPSQHGNTNALQHGLSEDMLRNVPKIKITTLYNEQETIQKGTNHYDTYDKFFLPSVEEMFGSPQVAGVEGDYMPYYKEAMGVDAPTNNANDGRKHYPIENPSGSAQDVRLRSCYRGNATYVWFCLDSGLLSNYGANYSYRCTPACAILKPADEE